MSLYQRIVCAIDFSEHSRKALRLAAALAGRTGGRVSAVHVIDLLLVEAAAAAYDVGRLKADAAVELRALVSEAAGSESRVETAVRTGPPDREVLAHAEEIGADLIAMGTQGLGGFRRLLFGSVTEKVLRSVTRPVLAVPHQEGHPPTPAPIGAVVAGLDLDDESGQVASHAEHVAKELGVPLTLFHAIPYGPLPPYAVEPFSQALSAVRSHAERKIKEAAGKLAGQVTVMTEIRVGGAAEELAALAAALPNALIVIGLGGGLLRRPGSTASRVLSLVQVPVVAVPARGAEGRNEAAR